MRQIGHRATGLGFRVASTFACRREKEEKHGHGYGAETPGNRIVPPFCENVPLSQRYRDYQRKGGNDTVAYDRRVTDQIIGVIGPDRSFVHALEERKVRKCLPTPIGSLGVSGKKYRIGIEQGYRSFGPRLNSW